MTKVNLQVRIPEVLMKAVEELAPRSKSEFIREAIQEKLRRERARRLEEEWITALKKHPDMQETDADWSAAEAWEVA